MALIPCKKCGHFVSDKADKCPKCGFPVALSMSKTEENKDPLIVSSNAEEKKVVADNKQPEQKNNVKGIIVAIITIVAIVSVVFALWMFPNKESVAKEQSTNVKEEVDSSVIEIEGSIVLYGTMTDVNGTYPIELAFEKEGDRLADCIYTNVDLGGKIRMKGEVIGNQFVFTGKDGNADFQIRIDKKTFDGIATDGPKELSVSLDKKIMTDSSGVDSKNAIDKAFYTITNKSVANILLGESLNDWTNSLMGQTEAEKQWFDTTFVDFKRLDYFGEISYHLFLNIYKKYKLQIALSLSYNDSSFPSDYELSQANINGFLVFSPLFKLPNGIHVGMSVEELINKYGATIQFIDGEGGCINDIVLEIPDCSDFLFYVNKEALLKEYGDNIFFPPLGNSEDWQVWMDTVKKAVIESCVLECIVIGTDSYSDYTYKF